MEEFFGQVVGGECIDDHFGWEFSDGVAGSQADAGVAAIYGVCEFVHFYKVGEQYYVLLAAAGDGQDVCVFVNEN